MSYVILHNDFSAFKYFPNEMVHISWKIANCRELGVYIAFVLLLVVQNIYERLAQYGLSMTNRHW
jgi:hypothetical protein